MADFMSVDNYVIIWIGQGSLELTLYHIYLKFFHLLCLTSFSCLSCSCNDEKKNLIFVTQFITLELNCDLDQLI